MSHTVLLMQLNSDVDSRMWLDFETTADCVDAICKIFEEHLKQRKPKSRAITYDISQLFHFIDQMADMSCLVCRKPNTVYVPRNKDWIKQRIYLKLSSQASG